MVANSDTQEDQTLKLRARDAVQSYLAPILEGAETLDEAKQRMQAHLEDIGAAARSVLPEGTTVTVTLQKEVFDTRDYDTFSLPAGIYESLRIVIGAGEGHNWWCVVFPDFCYGDLTEESQNHRPVRHPHRHLAAGGGLRAALRPAGSVGQAHGGHFLNLPGNWDCASWDAVVKWGIKKESGIGEMLIFGTKDGVLMLELRYGSDWVRNRDGVLSDLCREAALGLSGRILLVPEQFSHDMERQLCAAGGDAISRYAEVLSFTRLAGRVFSISGGGARECLDAGGRVGAMASAVEQLRPKLKSYAAASARPEFLTEMIRAVDEFKSCRVSAQDLRRASLENQGLLAQKLEELALLLEGYDAVCAQGKMDPRDRMTLLAERLAESQFAVGKKVCIDGFSDFTAQEMEIISILLEQTDVIVTINCDDLPTTRPEFSVAEDTARQLLQLAGRENPHGAGGGPKRYPGGPGGRGPDFCRTSAPGRYQRIT